MDAGFGDDEFGIVDFCEEVKRLALEEELDMAEVLTALTLAVRDLAIHQHGPGRARCLTVAALDTAFDALERDERIAAARR
jgi:hypothetical protein